MLLREHGRRHEHGDLFAVHHGLERGADGDFGLAKADVAANQPVHRFRFLHVGFGFLNGPPLVGRFLEDEGALEFALPGGVRFAGVAGLRFARGLNLEQFGGDIAHGAFGLFLGLAPAGAAQRVQRRMRLARTNIFADQMRFGDRHVKFRWLVAGIGRRVFDDETFLARFLVHPPIHIGGYVAG